MQQETYLERIQVHIRIHSKTNFGRVDIATRRGSRSPAPNLMSSLLRSGIETYNK